MQQVDAALGGIDAALIAHGELGDQRAAEADAGVMLAQMRVNALSFMVLMDELAKRLRPKGVRVLTIKPGFVATPMTAHLRQGLLFAKPAPVGRRIYQAMLRGEDVVYTPGFWALIMLIIRHIPERIFKHLRL